MIFLEQFGVNKHLLIFSKTTNCTRPTGSWNFVGLWKNLLVLIYSKLHQKSNDYLYVYTLHDFYFCQVIHYKPSEGFFFSFFFLTSIPMRSFLGMKTPMLSHYAMDRENVLMAEGLNSALMDLSIKYSFSANSSSWISFKTCQQNRLFCTKSRKNSYFLAFIVSKSCSLLNNLRK